jgi:hypothetical protein
METEFDIGFCFMVDPDSTPNDLSVGEQTVTGQGGMPRQCEETLFMPLSIKRTTSDIISRDATARWTVERINGTG